MYDHIPIEAISQLMSSLKSPHSTLLGKTHSCQALIYYNLKSKRRSGASPDISFFFFLTKIKTVIYTVITDYINNPTCAIEEPLFPGPLISSLLICKIEKVNCSSSILMYYVRLFAMQCVITHLQLMLLSYCQTTCT
ncbi:Uncharacterised protein [Legionella pneumophila]|nr:Uncharacterised protein [Legionella pneumophila]